MSAEDGTTTIAFVIWLPLIMAIFVMMTDVAYIMFNRSNAMRIVEDANRLVAVGAMQPTLVAETWLDQNLTIKGERIATNIDNRISQGIVWTAVEIPLENLDMFGIMSRILPNHMVVVISHHAVEDFEV